MKRRHYDSVFAEEYRQHAIHCFIGIPDVVDGCLPGGPPVLACDVGVALYNLAFRPQEEFHHTVNVREMLALPHPRAGRW